MTGRDGRQDALALVDFTPALAQPLVAMWRQSFEEALGIVDPHPLAEQHRYLMEEVVPRNAVKVALERGEVIGFVAANRVSVAQLYVRGVHQRRGLGTAMLEWAKARSGGSLWLFTFARNRRACAFYERHGFRVAARGFEPAWGLEDVRYEWRREDSG